jgi:hypothetical protein
MTLPMKEIVLAPGEGDRMTIGTSEVIFQAVGADTARWNCPRTPYPSPYGRDVLRVGGGS